MNFDWLKCMVNKRLSLENCDQTLLPRLFKFLIFLCSNNDSKCLTPTPLPIFYKVIYPNHFQVSIKGGVSSDEDDDGLGSFERLQIKKAGITGEEQTKVVQLLLQCKVMEISRIF